MMRQIGQAVPARGPRSALVEPQPTESGLSIAYPVAMDDPTTSDLADSTDAIRATPKDGATIELIVRRPGLGEREVLTEATLDPVLGLVGDDWVRRGSGRTPDGSPDPESQLTIMNTRVLAAFEPDRSRWPLAGDQLYADMDLGFPNLPIGSHLAVGDAEVVVTTKPHLGCAKFAGWYGAPARAWLASQDGLDLRMRGVYVRIVRGGTVRTGDSIRKL